jgi:hypothetical protein
MFFGPADLPTVAHELPPFGSLVTGELLLDFGALLAPAILCGANAVAPACIEELVRIGKDMGAGDVITGLFGRLVSRKTLGNLTLGKPRATNPGSAGVVSTRVIRVEVVGSRLKGSNTGR